MFPTRVPAARRRRDMVMMPALLAAALVSGGCSAKTRNSKPVWTQNQAEALLMVALEDESPDNRRRAIERISKSRYGEADLTIRTMGVIVATDAGQAVRRAAGECLGRSGNAAAMEHLIAVLDAENNADAVRPPDAALRRVCLEAADHLLCAAIEPHDAEPIIRPAARILAQDPDRDARIAAARLLRHFRHREALGALIDALNQPEFAVTYVAEQALVELTGHTHHRNYSDWMAWRNGTDDPFARGGDRSRDPSKPWWNIFTR